MGDRVKIIGTCNIATVDYSGVMNIYQRFHLELAHENIDL